MLHYPWRKLEAASLQKPSCGKHDGHTTPPVLIGNETSLSETVQNLDQDYCLSKWSGQDCKNATKAFLKMSKSPQNHSDPVLGTICASSHWGS